jgi:hypothetical protein
VAIAAEHERIMEAHQKAEPSKAFGEIDDM